jgi:hypothetical protein
VGTDVFGTITSSWAFWSSVLLAEGSGKTGIVELSIFVTLV